MILVKCRICAFDESLRPALEVDHVCERAEPALAGGVESFDSRRYALLRPERVMPHHVGSFRGLFEPCQRGTGAADAAIARLWVFLKRQPARKTAWKPSAIELIQEPAMIAAMDA